MLDLSGPLVLDGGLSTALEQQGADLGGALWTARLLADEPARIAAAHRSFFEAGARVATTASYQASVEGLVAAGYDATEARHLIAGRITIAREVADEYPDRWSPPLSVRTARTSPTARSTPAATA